jgi:hypothetical protein
MKDATITDLFDQRYWLRVLGMAYKNASVDKGLFVLDSIDGIYDLITKEDLHIPDNMKEDIYQVMRWAMREFSELRKKENTNVRTKRIRLSDYIAQEYGTRLNYGLFNLSDLGRRVTLSKIKQRIYTPPLFLLKKVSGLNNLVEYRDLVNDLDATQALKFTYKGISGLGEDGSSVQPIYKYVDPSHVGIIDLDASSNSDPGMTGMLCPMTKIYNRNFSLYDEPNFWEKNYRPLEKKLNKDSAKPISFDGGNPKFEYQNFRENIVQEELEFNRIVCPISDIDNPNFLYTCSQAVLDQDKNNETKNQLFTIKEDPDEL